MVSIGMCDMRVLPYFSGSYNDNTPSECIRRCKDEGYAYAGVQNAKDCFCGNLPPPSDLIVDQSQCNRTCPGDQNLTCGGGCKNNVYSTVEPGDSYICSQYFKLKWGVEVGLYLYFVLIEELLLMV